MPNIEAYPSEYFAWLCLFRQPGGANCGTTPDAIFRIRFSNPFSVCSFQYLFARLPDFRLVLAQLFSALQKKRRMGTMAARLRVRRMLCGVCRVDAFAHHGTGTSRVFLHARLLFHPL